ncbi:hypothetical protein C2E23DRAFT_948968 [Lenzites betulinus]|nr:hypothetical protein C2E23DRAFT_948968 [Lenzites betulinus]
MDPARFLAPNVPGPAAGPVQPAAAVFPRGQPIIGRVAPPGRVLEPPRPAMEPGYGDMPPLVDDDDDDDMIAPPELARPRQPAEPQPDDVLDILREVDQLIAQQGDEPDPPRAPLPPPLAEGQVLPPDPEYGYTEDVDVPSQARRRESMRNAALDGSGLSPEAIHRLRNPPHALPEVTRLDRAALRIYLARGDASEGNYEDVCAAIEELNGTIGTLPSYDQLKQHISAITGICTLETDMCPGSCLAYTGPFADLDKCSYCQEPRYDAWGLAHGKKIPRRTFKTFPIGPQNARLMRHRAERTQEILDAIRRDPGALNAGVYDDEVEAGRIVADDTVLMFSIDASDCWFFIWVLLDLPPTVRYKKRFVLPGGNIDSFMFPGLHHLAALERDGLKREFISRPYLLLATADGPGMAYLSGLVGHQGARGRLKPAANTYYPASLCPDNYDTPGSNHPDVPLVAHAQVLTQTTRPRLAAYQRIRLDTGVAKPSIFSACFGTDLMHLITLNLTDLITSLLRGTIVCDPTDDRATWDWAIFADTVTWQAHGRLVASATQYLPGSYDRPPRNPALKISSGYKAWEFLLYAPHYFLHFCKLVSAIRIVLQHSLPAAQLRVAHTRLLEYATEFEELYYRRQANRLHFVRQSVHATIHLATEVVRLRPGSLYTQWTLENFIGNITREIKQHVTPYENVAKRAFRRCQVNAIQAAMPELAPWDGPSENSEDVGEGYRLLRAKDRHPVELIVASEAAALRAYLQTTHGINIYAGKIQVTRWARLQLPNGQIARTAWKEHVQEIRGKSPRRARMVKLRDGRLAEVQYFCTGAADGRPFRLAMLSVFSPPDADLLNTTFGVLCACLYQGDASRVVVDAKEVSAAVAMVPLPMTPAERDSPNAEAQFADRYFLVEKPGLEVAHLGGIVEHDGNEDEGGEM